MSFTDADDVYATCTAAADLIERDGHYRGSFWGQSGRTAPVYEPGMQLCTLGAIRVAIGQYNDLPYGGITGWNDCAASVAVREELTARGVSAGLGVGLWNDHSARSADEVISLLRDVAAKHRPDAYRSGPSGSPG